MLTQQDLRHFRNVSTPSATRSRCANWRNEAATVGRPCGKSRASVTQPLVHRLNDLDVEADEDALDRATLAQIQRALGRNHGWHVRSQRIVRQADSERATRSSSVRGDIPRRRAIA